MSEPDRNCLSYWFPPLEAAGLPVPETRIVRTDIELTSLLDGEKPSGFDTFLDELLRAGREVGGYPFFLRTGHTSGKHEWRDTCYVEAHLGWHISALVEQSALADIMGLPTEVWAVRRLLDTEPLFICNGYGGFPVVREYRVFIREDEVEHIQPYWPPEAVEQGRPDRGDWRELLAVASRLDDYDAIGEICTLAGWASGAVGGGYWSVDCLQARDGSWYVTDMAEGGRSFRWEPE